MRGHILNKIFKQYSMIALAALIITIPAIINGFPFVFMDTIDYLGGHVRIFCPPAYGAFASTLRKMGNIWLIPAIQGFAVAYVLYYLNKVMWDRVRVVWYIGQIVMLTLFSSLPFVSSLIIADIFTPILFISFFILAYYQDKIDLVTKIILLVIFAFSAMAHVSNIYLGAGLLILMIMVELARGEFRRHLSGLAFVIGGLMSAVVVLLAVNVTYFKSLSLSPSAPTYMLANLVAQGPAKKYLQEVCPNANYKICKYSNQLPSEVNDFIWRKDGIVMRMGGFQSLNEEAATIVKKTLVKYPKEVATIAINSFAKSFFVHEPAAEIDNSITKENFPNVLEHYFGNGAKQQFLKSAQANGTFPHHLIRTIDYVVYPASLGLLIIAAIWLVPRYRDNKYLLPLFTFAFICGNNFLCSVGSGLFDRYQSRVSWLMVLALLQVLAMLIISKTPLKVAKR